MSYIVKNCPAITEYKFSDKVHKDCCQYRYGYCKDIDCVIKQVIEKCKERTVGFIEEGVVKEELLQLFDVEEIKE